MLGPAWTDLDGGSARVERGARDVGAVECPTCSIWWQGGPTSPEVLPVEGRRVAPQLAALDVEAQLASGIVVHVGRLYPSPLYSALDLGTAPPQQDVTDGRLVGRAWCPGAVAWRVTARAGSGVLREPSRFGVDVSALAAVAAPGWGVEPVERRFRLIKPYQDFGLGAVIDPWWGLWIRSMVLRAPAGGSSNLQWRGQLFTTPAATSLRFDFAGFGEQLVNPVADLIVVGGSGVLLVEWGA